MTTDSSLNLETFYPTDLLSITSVKYTDESILIKLKSKTHNCICQKCGKTADHYHGTYTLTVQDLPILGKSVLLE